MLYLLVDALQDFLQRHGLFGLVRVFTFVEFRAVASILLSFLFVVALAPRTIRFLVRLKVGDHPEFYNARLNELTKAKANTPTMGGILIAGAIFFSTLVLADLSNFYIQMALLCLVWMACLGAIDDWLKLTSARRKPGSREGLFSYEKLLFQVGLAVLLGIFIHHHGIYKDTVDPNHVSVMSHVLNLPFWKTWQEAPGGNYQAYIPSPHLIVLNEFAFILMAVIVITGSSNAVNLTDGMDGLASGVMTIVAFVFVILALLAGWQDGALAKRLLVPYIRFSDELSVVSGAMLGSCLGFLWFNANPAMVFMGDTGSLCLGGLIGYIAVVIRQEVLLLIVGGVFVAEALSVIMQVGYYKLTRGNRIFRCAPLHHHFHLGGWAENQVVVRFWLITAVLAALALATIKLR